MVGTSKVAKDLQLVKKQWDRYNDGLERGHRKYQAAAKLNERFYLGAGQQWEEDVKKELEAAGKPWLEENVIFSTVNTVLGYQTQSRMDIAFKPREDQDQEKADIITQLTMFIVDQNKFPWTESQVFADGLIQQRGYFDIRMGFEDNMYGDIEIISLDPLDVIPDPDAKSYDPKDWEDVTTSKWIPIDDIKILYGEAQYRKVLKTAPESGDFGEDSYEEGRNKFSGDGRDSHSGYYTNKSGEQHVKVLERQWYKLQNRFFWFDLESGDLFPVPDDMKEKEANKLGKESGYEVIRKVVKRIRWTVSTQDTILHDEWSPYDFFTIVPFFPYFRRGVTIGMVDNLIKTQEMVNKVFSQILHVINTTANSGWTVEQNSLTNMDTEDLEDRGADTGLVLEYKTGRGKPEKIEPNQIPTGLKDMMLTGIDMIKVISGVSETFQGGKGPEVSGTAIQSRVQQSAVQLATPIDNLFKTRHLLAERLLKLIQQYYTEERTFLITNVDKNGEDVQEEVPINQEDDMGNVINDLTEGTYDIVVSDVPTQVTFQNSQFAQAIEMRKYGIEIPDDEMILMSSLSRKNKIAKKVGSNESESEAAQQQQAAEMEKLTAEVERLSAQSEKDRAAALKSQSDVATAISMDSNVGPILDSIIAEADVGMGGGENVQENASEELLGGIPGPSQLGSPQEIETPLPPQGLIQYNRTYS